MKTMEPAQNGKRPRKSILPMPMEGLMRLDQVLMYYPVGKTTLYKEINEGRFPQQIKLGRSVFWDAVQVRTFLQKAGATVSLPKQSGTLNFCSRLR